MRRFSMSWSRGLLVTSVLASVLILATVVAPLVTGRAGQGSWWIGVAILVLAGSWATSPRALAVGGGDIRVERNFWRSLRIPLPEVTEIGPVPPAATKGLLRLFGNGGLFGYTGRFRSQALGPFSMQSTRRDRLVAIRTERRLTVVSPDDPSAFVDAVLSVAPRARRAADAEAPAVSPTPSTGDSPVPAPRREPTERPIGVLIFQVVVMAVPLLALAGLGVMVARTPREVRLVPGAVVVERRLWPEERFPVSDIRGASVLPAEALQGATRIRGSAALGALQGVFESPSLGRFDIYAPHTGLVLLETTHGEVVVGVLQPQRFQEELAAQIRAHRASQR